MAHKRSVSSLIFTALVVLVTSTSQSPHRYDPAGSGNRAFAHRTDGAGYKGFQSVVGVLWDSTGIDGTFQRELLTAVQHAFSSLNDGNTVYPQIIDVGTIKSPSRLVTSVKMIIKSDTTIVVSLLDPETLAAFTHVYEEMSKHRVDGHLKIVSPRLLKRSSNMIRSSTLCLQMNQLAAATALLNRVEKVGVAALIPVLDHGSATQLELLTFFMAAGESRMKPIAFTTPIVVTPSDSSAELFSILNDQNNAREDHGFLLLATEGSRLVMETASKSHNSFLMRWFSPSVIDSEEWALTSENKYLNASFGVYSTQFIGGIGWDNPSRRKTLRELQNATDSNPRIVSSILAYDAAWMAIKKAKRELVLPMQGLSGEISFDADGYRRNGYYFGMSAVPDTSSDDVALLQPSKWILEDVLYMVETLEGQQLITEYHVATSSMLTKEELNKFAALTANTSECEEHLMEIRSHDPFNQMSTVYLFTRTSLPNHILIPNQHGYGITFMCQHDDKTETTLKLACIPGGRYSDPVTCFRSHLRARQRRSNIESYRAYQDTPIYKNSAYYDSYKVHHGAKYISRKDDSYMNNNYYYGPPNEGGYGPVTPDTLSTRFDTPIVSDDTTATTPNPLPKVPELRQVLKAAKPFVGSCVGAATGCAMCVLVLGRLPLGTLPPACTGPCFVGVFGGCGALLGRAFSETTVICTELFRQGYLDIETFIADAEYGTNLKNESPMTLKGYQILAQPLVYKMRASPEISRMVAKLAVPWANYMKYSLGYSDEMDWLGWLINTLGTPVCFTVGYLNHYIEFASSFNYFSSDFSVSAALVSIIVSIMLFTRKKYLSKLC